MKERRFFKRIEHQDLVRCVALKDDFVGDDLLQVENVSGGGLRLLLNDSLCGSKNLSFEIRVPGYLKKIFARGEIKWANIKDNCDDIVAGVKFTNIDAYDRGMLLDFVHFEN